MNKARYKYKKESVTRYTFTSVGRKRIEKLVDFTDLGIRNTYNLAFGDVLPDGKIDDMSNSNNGDIVKVMSTVIGILQDFTRKNPMGNVAFAGSTPERMKLYTRILKSYYTAFSKEFRITALVKAGERLKQVPFDPKKGDEYAVFLIKRII
jgi:hypothetical protein